MCMHAATGACAFYFGVAVTFTTYYALQEWLIHMMHEMVRSMHLLRTS
jgi:hypothetical protein